MPEDEQLVKEVVAGSQAAMEVLTRKYYKQIFAYVYRKVGNRETAYDLTQEIFIKVFQRIQSYSNKGKFSSWLYTLAVNHCRDYWRSADYRQTSKQTELNETLVCEQNNVPYIFERKETREQVKLAINSLPDYQREVLILKYFHHMKIKEIADVTETNVSTVKSRLHQGLGKLAKLLKRGVEDEKQQSTPTFR
ncbi:RNA polymerase subunit sigma [Fictibacillus phosphorivorans]|uniref:RNA polymerase subunit sigma n=1 Tax=Fictibacillus phosphorivorans TaxID=1221500 RepID=A0A165P5Y1_9BACL|nr:RNA polymerase sigma factor [Fictibacillus phosphorivorans]KZE69090.1 RNA polymerase subunit sigma [Fictibacillus phosphorivorans]